MSEREASEVHGPVRTLRTELAEWDRAAGAWLPPRHLTIVTFRPDGQVSETESHNPDGSIARSARRYDSNGRVMEEVWWTTDNRRSVKTYSYDEAGRQTDASEISPDGTRRDAEACRYDALGRKVTVRFHPPQPPGAAIHYGVEGSEHAYGAPGARTSTVLYDERQLPLEVTFRDADGMVVLRVEFSRDAAGRVLTEVAQYGGETLFPSAALGKIPAEDRAQLARLVTTAFAGGVFSSTTCSYDENGRMLERVRRMGALGEERTSFEYDNRDNPILESMEEHSQRIDFGGDANAVFTAEPSRVQQNRFEYLYDEHSNWTERIVSFRTGEDQEWQRSNVQRRTITYYET